MRIRCEQCGAEGEVPGPGQYLCPTCKTPVSVSETASGPSEAPSAAPMASAAPSFPALPATFSESISIFFVMLLGGFLHSLAGLVLGITVSVGVFWAAPFIMAACTWWGVYLPYQLVLRTGKVFDQKILLASLIGALGLPVVGMMFLGVFNLVSEGMIFSRRPPYEREFYPLAWMIALCLIGMYLGSVIGYFARLAEWAMQSQTESPSLT